jgi:hypothetical protein
VIVVDAAEHQWKYSGFEEKYNALVDAGFQAFTAIWLVEKSWTALPQAVRLRLEAVTPDFQS